MNGRPTMTLAEAVKQATTQARRAYITTTLASCGHNVRVASRVAGVSPQSLYRIMHECGVEPARRSRGNRGNELWQRLR